MALSLALADTVVSGPVTIPGLDTKSVGSRMAALTVTDVTAPDVSLRVLVEQAPALTGPWYPLVGWRAGHEGTMASRRLCAPTFPFLRVRVVEFEGMGTARLRVWVST